MYIVSRNQTFAKLFFVVSLSGLFMYAVLAFYSFHTAFSSAFSSVSQIPEHSFFHPSERRYVDEYNSNGIKYILIWTVNNKSLGIREGSGIFLDNNCGRINCYITTNKNILNEKYTNFDVIIFNVTQFTPWTKSFLPKHRSQQQKYVFYSKEAASNYPICNVRFDNFFNWTWTYKFGSDIFSPNIEVKDKDNVIVAPRFDVKWTNNTGFEDSGKVGDSIEAVDTKSKAVIWVMKDCSPDDEIFQSIHKLVKLLKRHFLDFDMFGCGNNMTCPEDGCKAAVKRDYYFYIVYESNMPEDYVTDEVLFAYENYAVPILVGNNDYTKFLPADSYIHFKNNTDVNKLGNLITSNVRNPWKIREYFYWRKLYTIQKTNKDKDYCQLCQLVNNDASFKNFSSYRNFREWWNHGPLDSICEPAERVPGVVFF